MPASLSVTARQEADAVVLEVDGELDLVSARKFRAALYSQVVPGRTVRLDLSRIEFLDSSGLQLLVSASKSAAADGWTLQIVPPEGPARRVLGIAGMERILPLVPGD